ncbi:MAG: hypothetical protein M3Q39_04760 [Actinomycetota bacterium]|nr:hypothetical protein [Actinomycetota bacterium]
MLLRVNGNWACVVTESGAGHCWAPVPQDQSIEPLPAGVYSDVATDMSSAHCGIDGEGEILCGVGVCRPDPAVPGELLPCVDERGWDTTRNEPVRWRERVGTGPGGPFVKVRMAPISLFMCALRPNGVLECWGEAYESIRVQEPDDMFIDFGVGTSHVCAVTLGGEVRCWGEIHPGGDDWGQLAPPAWP